MTNPHDMCDRPTLAAVTLVLLTAGWHAAAAPAAGAQGLLVIAGAQDTTGAFRALDLPELGRRALVWPEGLLVLPDTAAWLDDGAGGLAFGWLARGAVGASAGGRFLPTAGRFELDAPLLLSDGAASAYLGAGRLEVDGERIVYRRPAARRDSRGDYYILAGVALATALLLRAVRRRTRRQ